MTETVTRWWWIRHAPVTTDGGCFYGQKDMPADTSDTQAYDALANALPRDAVWVTSHLQRTHQTAAAVGKAGYPLPEYTQHEALAEQHFGEWQGKPRAPVYEEFGGMHGFWTTMLETAPANGESFRDLRNRVDEAIDDITERNRGQDIVAVAHGGTIRAAIARALELPSPKALSFTIGNGSLTRIDLVERSNGASHWILNRLNAFGV